MNTLYDLLGARSDDDAEGLRDAFRKAAKANHPDLHAGDPDASIRFRRIVEAYDILRDAEQRAAYDQLLKLERERLRRKLGRTASYLIHNIVSDAVAVVGLAIVLGGGYTLFASISKTPIEAAKPVAVGGRGPAKIAAVRPVARTDTARDRLERTAAPEMPILLSAITAAANESGAPAVTSGRPIPMSVGLNTDFAKPGDALDVPVHQSDATAAADRPGRNSRMRPLDQEKGQAVEVGFFAMSDDKQDAKLPDVLNVNPGNVKIPEMKTPPRARTVAKRQAPSSAAFAQASLEKRNAAACSGSCAGDAPPLFGVGF